MKSSRGALLALTFAASVLRAQTTTTASLHDALTGHWTGALEYKDYRQPDKRVTLPTTVDVAPSTSGGVSLHFTYDDGPGKTVTGDDHFAMAENQATLEWTGVTEKRPTMFRVVYRLVRSAEGSR